MLSLKDALMRNECNPDQNEGAKTEIPQNVTSQTKTRHKMFFFIYINKPP